ncbi:hypothetical protein [Auritidibacter sp. NML100628]|uniref:hypothetical protein n=1 Tax=Auritidibacter sp. NML100628 TaxID=2170742 RepID=UPI000D739943|nr:hypothetical protein [Auritidibacter sp. NML100628]PXA77262.1 hypothetical protein DCC24_04870 [Auritidibacter sp. NML100628]
MIRNGKPTDHSGRGFGTGNIILFAVVFLLLLGTMFALSFWEHSTDYVNAVWIPGITALVLMVITFLIPKAIVGRSDTVDHDHIHDPKNLRHDPEQY